MFSYLTHLLKAKGPDRVHSPFVFDLYYHTLRNKYTHYSFKGIEKKYRSITNSSNKIIGESLFKIINKVKPQNILFVSDYSTKNALYISKARKKSTVNCIFHNSISTTDIEKQENIKISPTVSLKSVTSNTELIIIDNKSTNPAFEINDFNSAKMVIVTNVNTTQTAHKYWENLTKSNNYNIFINLYYFCIAIRRKEQGKEYFLLRL